MKRIPILLLLAAALFPSCQRDNYFEELGKPKALEPAALQADDAHILGAVAFPDVDGIPLELLDALRLRRPDHDNNLVLDSKLVVFGPNYLTADGTAHSDSLIAQAYHCGIIVAVVNPDYEKLSAWCDKKGIVFPGLPGNYGNPLLCAFSNRGWLYDMDDPRDRIASGEEDFPAWLNPFVAWVNSHIDAEDATSPYVIDSGDDLVFERNLACQKYDHTWFLSLRDTVKVLSQMTSHFTSWPISGAERDWFLCQARLSINNAPMFRGVGVSALGNISTKYCAYEMRQAGFTFEMGAGPQGANNFEAGPLPQSAAAGVPVSPDFDWLLPESGTFTEGPVTAHRSSALTAAVAPGHYGTGEMTFPDLSVSNLSQWGNVDFKFTVPSALLGYMHRTEIVPSEAQVCRLGRDDLQATWVWCCPQSDQERTLSMGATAVYTSLFFRSTTVGAGKWTDYKRALDAQTTSPHRNIRLLSPGRVLTGQLQLVNDFDDAASCVFLRFWAEGRDPEKDLPDYDAWTSAAAPGATFVRNMETGRYLMRFYKKSADGESMWLCERTFEISAAQATVIPASVCF